ncbi:MAG: hypothetical protein HZB25_07985 [Candidatus Eisenbacteria bacterium]|nr:hypothetical protein [Candidatus Eisenbacteria bacterium]
MNRLLALALCLAILLPAAAWAGECGGGDAPGCCRVGHDRDRGECRGSDRDEYRGSDRGEGRGGYRGEHGRRDYRHRRDWSHRQRGGTEFLLGVGFAGVTDTRDYIAYMDMAGMGHRGDGLEGGLAVDLGLRHWLTPELGLGIEAGYHGLGRGAIQDGGIMPLAGGTATPLVPSPGIAPPPYPVYSHRDHDYVIPITAVATLRALPYSSVRPYVKAGAGAYLVHGAPDRADIWGLGHRGLDVRFGGFGGAGLEFRSRGLSYGIEGNWHMVDAGHGEFDHLTLSAGIRFR